MGKRVKTRKSQQPLIHSDLLNLLLSSTDVLLLKFITPLVPFFILLVLVRPQCLNTFLGEKQELCLTLKNLLLLAKDGVEAPWADEDEEDEEGGEESDEL